MSNCVDYYVEGVPECVVNAFQVNYDEFHNFYKLNSKLAFVKLLKEKTGLGLKEAKEATDLVFSRGTVHDFEKFNLRFQRKNKLEELKLKMFSKELLEIIKSKSDETVISYLMKLDLSTLEEVLENFLED